MSVSISYYFAFLCFAGLIYLPLAKILALFVWFLLIYVIKVVDYLSDVPLAAYEFKNVSWIILIGYYAVLIGFVLYQKKKS
ncbi:MAG: ComEC/Rec2 family competence protein [bacterium]